MKKIFLLLLFVLLVVPASAQVNLNFILDIEDKIYYPNEKLEVEVVVDNQDISFAAKDTKLRIEIENRFYEFDLGDLMPEEKFEKTITLPEFPPGTHTIKGILNYSGFFEERFIEETYNSFEVAFPPIERYPRNVNVVGFNLPEKLEAGKSYDVSVIIKNEGTIGGNMIIEVASLDEFVDEEAYLGPGETKTIDMTINFKNTEVSLIEARVYALINGERYLLVYSGKRAYIVPERKAKLVFDRVEYIDEHDNLINPNDEVKLKIHLNNIGNYAATSVIGTLGSTSEIIEVIKAKSNYEAILVGESFGSDDTFEIKSKDTEDGEVIFNLNVNYVDSEPRTVVFKVPIKTTQTGESCTSDTQCRENEVCRSGKCEAIACNCGFIKDKQCIQYECCSDLQCGEFSTCNQNIHKCIQKSECINVINNGISSTKADIAFVGDGYFDYNRLKADVLKLVDYNGNNGYNGLMSVEPFKSNRNKFNIWMIKADNKITYENSRPSYTDAVSIAAQCTSADYTLIISKKKYRSYCYFGTPCFNSIGDPMGKSSGRLILHEFGHGFAHLADEYTESSKGNRYRSPNCAPDIQTAKSWWGDLEGKGGIGYFEGCSYVSGNIRPTENSIMFYHWVLKDTYYPVNERKILDVLNKYS